MCKLVQVIQAGLGLSQWVGNSLRAHLYSFQAVLVGTELEIDVTYNKMLETKGFLVHHQVIILKR